MTDIKEIIQSPVFSKQKKKLRKQQLKDLDKAVKYIFSVPTIGEMKVGDLQGITPHKFRCKHQRQQLFYPQGPF